MTAPRLDAPRPPSRARGPLQAGAGSAENNGMDAAQTVQAAVRAATQAAGGQQLLMRPVMEVTLGQMLAARVIGEAIDGQVELALAGRRVVVQSQVPLEPGQQVRLQVAQADDARIALRIIPDETPARGGAPALPGLPPAAARALMAALAELPAAQRPDPAALTSLAGRAVAAGVQTPAQADAFVRLAAAGLPTTPAAVAGLAELAEGPQLGRALTMIADALRAQGQPAPAAAGGQPQPAAPGQPATTTPGKPATAAPGPPAGAVTGQPLPSGAPVSPGMPATPAPIPAAPGSPAGQQPAPGSQSPATPGQPPPAPGAPPGAQPAVQQGQAPPAPATTQQVPASLGAFTALVEDIARRAAGGDPKGLRRAIADLGHGQEARLRAGEAPDASLRSLLLGIASDPETPQPAARLAERTADALAAQALAPSAAAPATDPSAQGAYLQVPLPGGQTAEVRVMPDHEGGGPGGEGGRSTRIAFLLTMSSLGQMVVEATVGAHGTDAVVRSSNETVREFLKGRTADLADALERAGGGERPVRVGVDRMAPGAQRRVLPGPPASGLDLSA